MSLINRDLVKIHVVSRFPIPFIISNLKVFLGLTKYYQTFIHGYAKIVGVDQKKFKISMDTTTPSGI
jgi:hypothetical protein